MKDTNNTMVRVSKAWLVNYTGSALLIVSQLLYMAIMARLVSKQSFATYGFFSIIYSGLLLFQDIGFSKAFIQHRVVEIRVLSSTIFKLNILIGLLLSVGIYTTCFSAWLFGWKSPYFMVMPFAAIVLILELANVQLKSHFDKQKKFEKLMIVRVAGRMFGLAVALSSTLFVSNWLPLFLGVLLPSIFTSILLLYYVEDFDLVGWDLGEAKKLLTFSLFSFAFGMMNFVVRNIDKIIVGHRLTSTEFAEYGRAYTFLMLSATIVVLPIGNIVYRTLSEHESQDILYMATLKKYVYGLTIVNTVASCVIFIYADLFTLVFLGENWMNTTLYIRYFGILSLFQVIMPTLGWHFNSRGNSKTLFYIQCLQAFSLTLIILIPFNDIISVMNLYWKSNILFLTILMVFLYKNNRPIFTTYAPLTVFLVVFSFIGIECIDCF